MINIIGSQKRLEILKLLSQKDRYVSEIMESAKIDGKNANHHLKKLKENDLIDSYREGRRKYYTLKKEIKLEIKPPPQGKFLLYTTRQTNQT